MANDDFTQSTIELLAKRAGYECSNPDCKAPTIGACEADKTRTVSVGVAAHIAACRPGGPRYDAKMSSEQRRDSSNGIWLCQTCSRKIDVNNGIDYPVTLLLDWKSAHERTASASIGRPAGGQFTELAGTIEASGTGNIVGAEIGGATRIKSGTHISASGVGNVTAVIVRTNS